MRPKLPVLVACPALVMALACGSADERPPAIDPVACPDAGCMGYEEPITGAAPACDPERSLPGNAVVTGTVLSLDDPTFALAASVIVDYDRLERFVGRARVDIDSGGCALASAQIRADGTFTVEGVRDEGEHNFVRVVPLAADRPHVITISTISTGNVSDLRVPILTRNVLTDVFSYLSSPPDVDDTKGHVIVKVVDVQTKAPYEGALVSGLNGVTAYDTGVSDQGTGTLGLGFFLNVPAEPYPGEPRAFSVEGVSDVTGTTVVSADAVSLFLVGMGTY